MDYNAARANLDNTPFLDDTMLQHHPVMMRSQVVMKDHGGTPWPDQANTRTSSSSYTDQLMARTNPEIPANRSGFDMTVEGLPGSSNGRASASLRSSLRSSYANGSVSRDGSVAGVVAGLQKRLVAVRGALNGLTICIYVCLKPISLQESTLASHTAGHPSQTPQVIHLGISAGLLRASIASPQPSGIPGFLSSASLRDELHKVLFLLFTLLFALYGLCVPPLWKM